MAVRQAPGVKAKFESYPKDVLPRMTFLRSLIVEAAQELGGSIEIEETLKWGEPSYLTDHGSTIRMDWKERSPNEYAMYFKCTSLLVPTFKRIFGETFQYEGHRAIVFQIEDPVPVEPLKACIKMALRYHKVKKLEHLGYGTQ